jgi:cytochrome c biogenesis protein CcmG, thiol:disulfide interchange protein DsbE
MSRFAWPLLLFLALAGVLVLALRREGDPQALPSPLIGKPIPSFALGRLQADQPTVSPQQFKGQVWLLNVWASWCTTCREEHPTLLKLAADSGVPVVGLNYQDKPDPAQAWLAQHGNPFTQVAMDADGRVGIDLGVVGVPETFVIDREGRIRHKVTGALTPEIVQTRLLPLIKELQGG